MDVPHSPPIIISLPTSVFTCILLCLWSPAWICLDILHRLRLCYRLLLLWALLLFAPALHVGEGWVALHMHHIRLFAVCERLFTVSFIAIASVLHRLLPLDITVLFSIVLYFYSIRSRRSLLLQLFSQLLHTALLSSFPSVSPSVSAVSRLNCRFGWLQSLFGSLGFNLFSPQLPLRYLIHPLSWGSANTLVLGVLDNSAVSTSHLCIIIIYMCFVAKLV